MAGEKVISGDMRLTFGDKTVYHSITCDLSLGRDFKDRATKDTTGTERAKGTKNWSATLSGLATYDGDGIGTLDFFGLFDLYDDDTDVPVAVEFVPSEGDATWKLQGDGFITLDGTFSNDEDGTISIAVTGSGSMAKVAV
jgi:hypothetical protein